MYEFSRYMFTLNPEINRSPFTVEEDCILMAAIKEYGTNFRGFPTNLLPGRNMKQIRSRYNNVLKHVNVREHWTEEHDKKLMKLVEQFGTSEWVKIADEMVSHSRTSCRQRYQTIQKFLDKNPDKTIADVPRRKRAFSTNVTTENWMETIIEAKNFDSIEMDDDCQNDCSETPTKSKTKTTKDSQNQQRMHSNAITKPSIYNMQYYDFLKYSFDFKLGKTITASDTLFENVQIACQLLQAPTLPRRIDIFNASFSRYVTIRNDIKKVQLEPDLLHSLIQLGKNDFLFPVNMNTILGMRALTIMFEDKNSNKKKSAVEAVKSERSGLGHDALNLFKMRFRSMFNHTAKLAKMKRSFTSVSLRLRCQKRQHVNEIIVPSDLDFDETNNTTIDDSNEGPSSKRLRYIGSADSNTGDPMLQASTSRAYASYRYRVETSNKIREIKIQPSESGTDTDAENITTEFVIWTPTVTDEATGSATIQTFNDNR